MVDIYISFSVSASSLASSLETDETEWDMAARIEKMLFPANSEPNIVSENHELFQVVMSEFHAYEVS